MAGFAFRNTENSKLRFKISPRGNFARILETVNEIHFPPTILANEQIVFVILELVSNSMRAHNEQGVNEPITLDLFADDSDMFIIISDRGGGFDPSRLPYSFEESVNDVDVMSDEFKAYREQYENNRFGMGLIAARKVFPIFKMSFVDGEANVLNWPSSMIIGTTIKLGCPILKLGGEN